MKLELDTIFGEAALIIRDMSWPGILCEIKGQLFRLRDSGGAIVIEEYRDGAFSRVRTIRPVDAIDEDKTPVEVPRSKAPTPNHALSSLRQAMVLVREVSGLLHSDSHQKLAWEIEDDLRILIRELGRAGK